MGDIELWHGLAVKVSDTSANQNRQYEPIPVIGASHEQAIPFYTSACTFFLFL